MSKVYKGYELYKMIANREIDKNSKFKDNNDIIWIWNGIDFESEYSYSDIVFSQMDFELIEDEIDINSIEKLEIDKNNFIQTELGAFKTRKMDIAFLDKINELVQAVKQNHKEIKELKEKK